MGSDGSHLPTAPPACLAEWEVWPQQAEREQRKDLGDVRDAVGGMLDRLEAEAAAAVPLGLGRIVALRCRSSTLYRVREYIRCLCLSLKRRCGRTHPKGGAGGHAGEDGGGQGGEGGGRPAQGGGRRPRLAQRPAGRCFISLHHTQHAILRE